MKKSIFILASLFMLLISLPIFAQADPGDDPEAVPAPIDGGLSLLIAAGMLYGAKKVIDGKNK
ncbi:MAG: hypothetical protein GZ087_04370 [Flavobacterium sp.]|nr:hypothetical protein [Flavobacterium sp.]